MTNQIADEAAAWLAAGAPYAQGLSLYVRAYPRARDIAQFQAQLKQTFVSPALVQRLRQALQVLAKAAKPLPPALTSSLSAKPISAAMPTADDADPEPASVIALRQKAKPLHRRMDYLRAELRHATSDAARLTLAHEIVVKVNPALTQIYDQLRAFAKTGIEPADERLERFREEVAAEVYEYNALHNLAKRNLATMTEEQKARLVQLRAKYNRHREASYNKTA